MKIAVVGCSHGELDAIYNHVANIEARDNTKVDLLICCGDFQATRNESDLRCMAIPIKYYDIGSFYKYYSGNIQAPYLTIIIGGNHEASNYMQELPYGGWLAPNIYYLGYAGVINYGGVKIGGLSGIFKPQDYLKGHFEKAPYNNDTKRSVYHVRNIEVFRLKQMASNTLDIMMSHDWPREVYSYGDINELLRNKPFFEQDVNENKLGSKPCEELLTHLKPKYWFAAHLHTKFCATVPHFDEKDVMLSSTKFMALDKCLPKRKWIDIVDVPHTEENFKLCYDLEWLTILYLTDHLMSDSQTMQFMPGPTSDERWNFNPTEEEKEMIKKKIGDDLIIPDNFCMTAPSYEGPAHGYVQQSRAVINPQTVLFCEKLGIHDPLRAKIESSNNQLDYPHSPRAFSTPRAKHFDSSSSFSEMNGSQLTFLSDTNSFLENSPSCTPAKNSLLLNLPPPSGRSTNVTTDNEDSEEKTSICEKRTLDDEGSSPMLFQIDTQGNYSHTVDSTPKRQFKRRNQSMYSSQSSDY